MERRTYLKVKNGGLGFRTLSDRFLLLNSLCKTMPLAIDRKDEKVNITRGLWNSLMTISVLELSMLLIKRIVGRFSTLQDIPSA